MTEQPWINSKADALFHQLLADYREQYDAEIAPQWSEKSEKERLGKRPPIEPDALLDQWADAAANYCESPIEQLLLAALVFSCTGYGPWPMEMWWHDSPFDAPKDSVFVAAQFPFGKYRLDLAMFGQDFSGNEFRVAIECDGHNYHKTKDQVRHDRQRDRFLQIRGWRILRFSGSEIWADAEACADEVGEFITELFDDDMERTGVCQTADWRTRRLAKLGYVSPFSKPAAQ